MWKICRNIKAERLKKKEIYEQGLKILLKKHYMEAFDVLLHHELITVDNFLENISIMKITIYMEIL